VLALSVLGPFELRRGGELVSVPAGKTTELLIRLALDAGVPVRVERLIDDLWGADGLPTQRNTMQAKISKLRRALGGAAVVTSTAAGYAFEVDRGSVDAFGAVELGELASARLADGDPAAVVEICGRALGMFRGDVVLPGAGEGDWVVPHRARLEEVRLGLIEDQLEARLQLGAGREVIGELEALVVRYPVRERLWELLVTALYRAGRQADALATYQRVRAQLADELGLDPGPRLQRLEAQVLAQDATLGALNRPLAATLVTDAPAGNVPSMSVELVGRETELAALTDLLAVKRLVEIVGPGGVGKTAVAVEVGRRLMLPDGVPGGVWLARLESASTDEGVIDVLISAMDVAGGEAALFERLQGVEAVVILDNCEQVVDAAAALAVRLLDAGPGVRVLCTSQVPLYVDGETVFELATLALPDAVELFSRRAAAQRSSDPRWEADEAVFDLCRSLDGLPLAIELAAARTKTLSLEDISRRLEDRFAVLSDPTSRRPERRRSLRSTIRWSYDLLFPDDQRGLWALATFSGGAPLPAVESVLEALGVPAAAAIDVVGRLASRSLVTVDDAVRSATSEPDRAVPASVRYQLLDSIRAFALEAMTEAGTAQTAQAAHATWFAAAADACTAGVRSSRQAEHLAFSRAERANIDTALAWSAARDPQLGLRIVNGFGWSWVVLGDHRGAQRIVTALDAAGDAAAGNRASALLLAAWLEASSGNLDVAREHISAAAYLADAIDDVDLRARGCYYLAYVVSHHGDFEQAMELTDRSRALYDGLDRPWDQAANGLFAARAAISAGDREHSVEAAARVKDWLRRVDDPWLHVRGEAMLGELARLQYRFDDAVLHIGRAAEESRRLGFQQTEAYQVSSLGRAQCQAGDYAAGAATLRLAVDKAEATGDVRLAALARVHVGRVLRALGEVVPARTALEAATAWHRDAGGGEQAALGECLLAAMDAADRVSGADERLVHVLGTARQRGDAPVEVFALDALGRLAAQAGDMARAQELYTEADRRMSAAAHFITDRDRTDAHAVRSPSDATAAG
jgi:predicted ATPase/DNA-binding SARP family transcriptional activator